MHKYHIDGGVNCEKEHGICNTLFVINSGNHTNFNFRDLDLSDLVNADKIVIQNWKETQDYCNDIANKK